MPEPIEITIDLGKPTEFNRVAVRAYTSGRSYEVLASTDGKTYERVAERLTKPEESAGRAVHDFPTTTARYIRLVTHGNKGQVFDPFSRIT